MSSRGKTPVAYPKRSAPSVADVCTQTPAGEVTRDQVAPDLRGNGVNVELSKTVARAVRGRAKECWKNAFAGLTVLPDLDQVFYVEGFAVTRRSRLVIEHGWIEKAGEVVDPTIPEGLEAYFAGFRFTPDQAAEVVAAHGYRLPVAWELTKNPKEERYERAFADAWSHVHGLRAMTSTTKETAS